MNCKMPLRICRSFVISTWIASTVEIWMIFCFNFESNFSIWFLQFIRSYFGNSETFLIGLRFATVIVSSVCISFESNWWIIILRDAHETDSRRLLQFWSLCANMVLSNFGYPLTESKLVGQCWAHASYSIHSTHSFYCHSVNIGIAKGISICFAMKETSCIRYARRGKSFATNLLSARKKIEKEDCMLRHEA